MVIAIDGYSSCGKSTLAYELAQNLNYLYIDSGAMYRAIAYYFLQNDLKPGTDQACDALKDIEISFRWNPDSSDNEIWMNGENIERNIRNLDVASIVSEVAAMPCVRGFLLEQQRDFAKTNDVVMDGRDIGTVIFPDAEVKIFVQADFDTRVDRRYKELLQRGDNITRDEVAENLKKRDYIDKNREIAPLKMADDAVLLDNTLLSKEEQIKEAMSIIKPHL